MIEADNGHSREAFWSPLACEHESSIPTGHEASGSAPGNNVLRLKSGEAYAAALNLLAQSDRHRSMQLGIADAMVRRALQLDQMKFYRKHDRTIGFALWAYLNDEVEARLLEGGSALRPDELKIGSRLWVLDIVTPFGGLDAARLDLLASLFNGAGYRELPRPGYPSDSLPMSVSSVSRSISYRQGTPEDAASLAPRLRRQDTMELSAATGKDSATALSDSVVNAKRCWSVVFKGRVIAMFGVGHIPKRPLNGLVWMLGSDDLVRQGRALVHDGPVWISEMMKGHTAIGNLVDARNEASIRWLKRLGFHFFWRHDQYGLEKRPFWEFAMTPFDLENAFRLKNRPLKDGSGRS